MAWTDKARAASAASRRARKKPGALARLYAKSGRSVPNYSKEPKTYTRGKETRGNMVRAMGEGKTLKAAAISAKIPRATNPRRRRARGMAANPTQTANQVRATHAMVALDSGIAQVKHEGIKRGTQHNWSQRNDTSKAFNNPVYRKGKRAGSAVTERGDAASNKYGGLDPYDLGLSPQKRRRRPSMVTDFEKKYGKGASAARGSRSVAPRSGMVRSKDKKAWVYPPKGYKGTKSR